MLIGNYTADVSVGETAPYAVIPGVAHTRVVAALPVNALRRAVRFYDLPLEFEASVLDNRIRVEGYEDVALEE